MVYGTVDEVSAKLAASGTDAARFQPVQFVGEPVPEVIALKMEHVSMLANATPTPAPADEAQLESDAPRSHPW